MDQTTIYYLVESLALLLLALGFAYAGYQTQSSMKMSFYGCSVMALTTFAITLLRFIGV